MPRLLTSSSVTHTNARNLLLLRSRSLLPASSLAVLPRGRHNINHYRTLFFFIHHHPKRHHGSRGRHSPSSSTSSSSQPGLEYTDPYIFDASAYRSTRAAAGSGGMNKAADPRIPHFHPWESVKASSNSGDNNSSSSSKSQSDSSNKNEKGCHGYSYDYHYNYKNGDWMLKWKGYRRMMADEEMRKQIQDYVQEMKTKIRKYQSQHRHEYHFQNSRSQEERRKRLEETLKQRKKDYETMVEGYKEWKHAWKKEATGLRNTFMKRLYNFSEPYVKELEEQQKKKETLNSNSDMRNDATKAKDETVKDGGYLKPDPNPPWVDWNGVIGSKEAEVHKAEAVKNGEEGAKFSAAEAPKVVEIDYENTEIDYITLKRVPRKTVSKTPEHAPFKGAETSYFTPVVNLTSGRYITDDPIIIATPPPPAPPTSSQYSSSQQDNFETDNSSQEQSKTTEPDSAGSYAMKQLREKVDFIRKLLREDLFETKAPKSVESRTVGDCHPEKVEMTTGGIEEAINSEKYAYTKGTDTTNKTKEGEIDSIQMTADGVSIEKPLQHIIDPDARVEVLETLVSQKDAVELPSTSNTEPHASFSTSQEEVTQTLTPPRVEDVETEISAAFKEITFPITAKDYIDLKEHKLFTRMSKYFKIMENAPNGAANLERLKRFFEQEQARLEERRAKAAASDSPAKVENATTVDATFYSKPEGNNLYHPNSTSTSSRADAEEEPARKINIQYVEFPDEAVAEMSKKPATEKEEVVSRWATGESIGSSVPHPSNPVAASETSKDAPTTINESTLTSQQETSPYSKFTTADAIASLRYYEKNRGTLPDEEPLSAEDIAILKSIKDKPTQPHTTSTSSPASPSPSISSSDTYLHSQAQPQYSYEYIKHSEQEASRGDKSTESWSTMAKLGTALGAAVVGTYVIGVGSKLVEPSKAVPGVVPPGHKKRFDWYGKGDSK